MGTSPRNAGDSMRAEGRQDEAVGPGGRIAAEERHALAVSQSLRWAERAACEGDYERALGWLRMVEQVDGALGAEWRARRETWLAAWRAQTRAPELRRPAGRA